MIGNVCCSVVSSWLQSLSMSCVFELCTAEADASFLTRCCNWVDFSKSSSDIFFECSAAACWA